MEPGTNKMEPDLVLPPPREGQLALVPDVSRGGDAARLSEVGLVAELYVERTERRFGTFCIASAVFVFCRLHRWACLDGGCAVCGVRQREQSCMVCVCVCVCVF